MDRTIQIENYLPSVVREVDVFQQIAKAQNPEFNLLNERIVQTFSERFIKTAGEYGVRRWESLLLIPSDNNSTLEQRKERILSYLNIKIPYTWRMLENMLSASLGNGNFKLKYDNELTKLSLTLKSTHYDIESFLEKVLPVNVIFEVNYNNTVENLFFTTPVYYGGNLTLNRTIFIK